MRAAGRQQPGDPVRERASLPRAGAREDQQWALVEGDRLALRPVELRQQALDLIGARLDGTPIGLALYLLFDVGDGPRIVLGSARSAALIWLNRSEWSSRTGP
jgi:hypothetical protein